MTILLAALLLLTVMPAGAQTLPLVADVNCDQRSSAADFSAAVIVSGDGTQFPDCRAADFFRDQLLTDGDFLPLFHDIFGTFNTPWTPTPTPSPTLTRTGVPTATPTVTAVTSAGQTPSSTPSPSPTQTPSATPTHTSTRVPTQTLTATPTRTPLHTHTPTATRTPTGVAFQLSGDWFANWSGQICYLAGVPFLKLDPTTYRVTAVNGQLDIEIVGGASIGRGLEVDATGTVRFQYRVSSDTLCFGVHPEFVFDFVFTFQANGTGSAGAHWTYGFNTNCAVCEVTDTATLQRVSLPGQ